MITLRKKSGNVLKNESPLHLQKFSRIVKSLRDDGIGLDTNLNEATLADMVFNLQTYMEENFGRNSKFPRTVTKFPAWVYQNFAPSGPLRQILQCSIEYMSEKGFDKLTVEAELIQRVETTLRENGFLRPFSFYFAKVSDANFIERMKSIIQSHRGEIAQEIESATHVIEWDDEVDNLPEELTEDYIRPIEVRPNDSDGSLMALVHWYYYPDSYDEWLPAEDVDMTEPPDTTLTPSAVPLKQWHVGCRFVLDCEVFNEWGNEVDYECEADDDDEEEDGSATPKSAGRGRKRGKRAHVKKVVKKDAPIPESISCTSRMMQDVSPLTLDTQSDKTPIIVDIIPGGPSVVVDSATADAAPTTAFTQTATVAPAPAPAHAPEPAPADSTSTASNSTTPTAAADTPQQSPKPEKRKADDIEGGGGGDKQVGVESKKKRPTKQAAAAAAAAATAASASSDPAAVAAASGGDGDQSNQSMHYPSWFVVDLVSDFELRYIPEILGSAVFNRRYLDYRTYIMRLSEQNPTCYISATECRRKIAGDVCTIVRVHEFLDAFGLINSRVNPENRPPPMVYSSAVHFREDLRAAVTAPASSSHEGQKCSEGEESDEGSSWSVDEDSSLLKLVLEFNADWDKVAAGLLAEERAPEARPQKSASECLLRFVQMSSTSLFAKDLERANGAVGSATGGAAAAGGGAVVGGGVASPGMMVVEATFGVAPAAIAATYAQHSSQPLPLSVQRLRLLAQETGRAALARVGLQQATEITRALQSADGVAAGKSKLGEPVSAAVAVVAAATAEAGWQTLEGLDAALKASLDDYMSLRLEALEEKVQLLNDVEDAIEVKRMQVDLDRRDVQTQRAILSFQQAQLNSSRSFPL